ncbi:MAG: DMT family transporter [Clostridia bacterium]|nr:DMT family transporter [Clostridia bacterium]
MSKKQSRWSGPLLAVPAVIFWGAAGTAFSVLTPSFSEIHLFGISCLAAYILLWLIRPVILPPGKLREELNYLIMGVSGVIGSAACLYGAKSIAEHDDLYLFMTLTPIVVVLVLCVTGKKDKIRIWNLIGLVLGIIGAVFCIGNGRVVEFGLNPKFLVMLLGAMLCWGVYSVMAENRIGVHPIWVTRRMMFWVNLIVVPYIIFRKGLPAFPTALNVEQIVSFLILGLFGAGLGFVFYNGASQKLGADAAVNYLYLLPAVRLVVSIAMGDSKFHWHGPAGAAVLVLAVAVSQIIPPEKEE